MLRVAALGVAGGAGGKREARLLQEAEDGVEAAVVAEAEAAVVGLRREVEADLLVEVAELRDVHRLRLAKVVRRDQEGAGAGRHRVARHAGRRRLIERRVREERRAVRRIAGEAGDRRRQAVSEGAMRIRLEADRRDEVLERLHLARRRRGVGAEETREADAERGRVLAVAAPVQRLGADAADQRLRHHGALHRVPVVAGAGEGRPRVTGLFRVFSAPAGSPRSQSSVSRVASTWQPAHAKCRAATSSARRRGSGRPPLTAGVGSKKFTRPTSRLVAVFDETVAWKRFST
jgi:hypothetical protein